MVKLSNVALLMSLSTTALIGCSDNRGTLSGLDEPSQVVARVNGEEISLLQYRRALNLARVKRPTPGVHQEVIGKLVDRELAVAQARELRLDRQPDVLVELEEARRDVLARSWARRVAAAAQQPDDSLAARYYAENPELFAERRIFHLREVAIRSDGDHYSETRSRLAGGEPIEETLSWLKAQGVPLKEQVVIRAAEQLPIDTLPRLSTTATGRPAYFETPRGLLIYEVLDRRDAPLDWDKARPVILEHLARQTGKAAVVAEKRRLRALADIEYSASTMETVLASLDRRP
jgi:EpsD family peptidyl-prolyl cis-trans isomerase